MFAGHSSQLFCASNDGFNKPLSRPTLFMWHNGIIWHNGIMCALVWLASEHHMPRCVSEFWLKKVLVSKHVPKQKLLIYQTGLWMVQTLRFHKPLLANTCLGSVGHSYTQEDEAQPEESSAGTSWNSASGLTTPFWSVRFNNSPSIEILEFILCSW